MIKHAQTICAKYCRRGFTSVASSVKHGWEEQEKLVLGFVFMGGWFGQAFINSYKKRQQRLRVDRFFEDEDKRHREKKYLLRKKMEGQLEDAEKGVREKLYLLPKEMEDEDGF